MRRVIVAFLVGLTSVGVTVAACKNTFSNHCFNNRADLTCIDRYGRDRPFCSGCVSENDGCVAGPVEDASCLPVPTCASSIRNELTPDEFCAQVTDGDLPVCNACSREKAGCVTEQDATSLEGKCLWQPGGGTGTGTGTETGTTADETTADETTQSDPSTSSESNTTSSSTSTVSTTDGSSTSIGSDTSTATTEAPECRTDDDCMGHPNGPACGPANTCVQCTETNATACQDPTPVCDDSNTCVGCVLDDDCLIPELAHCTDTQECDGCTDDMHCSHLPDTPICEDTVCVECLDEDDCGGNVCDRKYLTCTNAAPGSAGRCDPCVATAQCQADMACVQMNVDGTDTGYFCQWLRNAPQITTDCGDVRPFSQEGSKAAVEGGTVNVCSLRFASCQALSDMSENLTCNTGEHDECGISGIDDGRCDETRCSIRCFFTNDCPEGVSCTDNVCDV